MADPRQANDRVFQMRVSSSFLETLDSWRRVQPDIPSRAEAVRRLVEAGALDHVKPGSERPDNLIVVDPDTNRG